MKTFIKLLAVTLAVFTADEAKAENAKFDLGTISSETAWLAQLEIYQNPLRVRVNSLPNRNIVVRIYEIHPDGYPVGYKEKIVEMPAIVPYRYYESIRFRNLKAGSGIRYVLTFRPKTGRQSPVNVIVDGVYNAYRPDNPLYTPYQLPRGAPLVDGVV